MPLLLQYSIVPFQKFYDCSFTLRKIIHLESFYVLGRVVLALYFEMTFLIKLYLYFFRN